MKKLLLFFCIAFAAQVVLTACNRDDNPVPGVDKVDNPQETVTDQPAN